MNGALIERYRCPEKFVQLELKGQLSADTGFFRLGIATCYGRSAAGFRSSRVDTALYDVASDVTTHDSAVVLPFDPSEVIENLRLERYENRSGYSVPSRWKKSLKSAYYAVRPWMHPNLRQKVQRAYLTGWRRIAFPHWPVDTTVEDLNEQLLLRCMKANGVDAVPFVWFWPDDARACVLMSHDVEERRGLDFCTELMDMDDSAGIRASFHLIPEGRYQISTPLVQAFRDRGFEVNIHDLNHDGRLFRDNDEFSRRAVRINRYGKMYGATGFRSGVLYRNQDWFGALDFSFDMSVPNVAHLDPQRGGCCTVNPYFIGKILVIPLKTTQDYMLFHLLGEFCMDLWTIQTSAFFEENGLISFLVHPDYIIESRARDTYRRLLDYLCHLRSSERLWFALPGEIDEWWRARRKMRVVERDGEWRIEGSGAERAQLAFARAAGDHVEYEVGVRGRAA
jgi:hypothetical protein